MSRLRGPHVTVAERLLGFIEREMSTEPLSVIATALGLCREHVLFSQRQRRTPACNPEEKSDHVSLSLSHS